MDFLTVLKRIDQLLANQIVELNKEIEREKIIISHHHRIDCFQDLHYKVSQFALDKLLEQFNYAVGGHEDSPTCAGMFTDTYGLPCKHEITNYAAPPSATTCWGTARDPGPSHQLQALPSSCQILLTPSILSRRTYGTSKSWFLPLYLLDGSQRL